MLELVTEICGKYLLDQHIDDIKGTLQQFSNLIRQTDVDERKTNKRITLARWVADNGGMVRGAIG